MENVSIKKSVNQETGQTFYYISVPISDDYEIKKYLKKEEILILKLKGIIN